MMKKYKLLPEHEAQFKSHTQKWIDNGLSTKPMDDYDREQMRVAIRGLYTSAGLFATSEELAAALGAAPEDSAKIRRELYCIVRRSEIRAIDDKELPL